MIVCVGFFGGCFGDLLVAYKVKSGNGRLEGELFLRCTQNKCKTFFPGTFISRET